MSPRPRRVQPWRPRSGPTRLRAIGTDGAQSAGGRQRRRNQKAAGHGSRAAGAFRWLMLASVSAAALAAAPAFAQAAAPQAAPAAGPEEIVVTAQKRRAERQQGPDVDHRRHGAAARPAGIKQPRDLVKLTPGFSYAELRGGSPVYTLRGVGFYDTASAVAPTVSVYADQAPLPFADRNPRRHLRSRTGRGAEGAAGHPVRPERHRRRDQLHRRQADPRSSGRPRSDATAASTPLTPTASSAARSPTLCSARIAVERTERSDGWQKSYTTGKTNGVGRFHQRPRYSSPGRR